MGRAALVFSFVVLAPMAAMAQRVDGSAETAPQMDETTAMVQAHDERAQALFAQGDYAGALREMESAQSLLPATSRLYNLAVCRERLGQTREAIILYQRFIEAGDAPAERRGVAAARLERLSTSAGAVEPSPVSSLDEVGSGETASSAAIEPATSDVPTTEPPPEPTRTTRRRLSRTPFFALLAVTLASGAAMTALGAVTLAKFAEWKDHYQYEYQALSALQDEGQALSTATNALLGLTLVGALVTAVLAFFTEWRSSGHGESPRLGVARSLDGLLLSGRL